jgi:glucose-1-phosphate adenylyltransferase
VFDPDVLADALVRDAAQDSAHDFGHNILPMLAASARVYVYNFLNNDVPGTEPNERGYWKDVGSVESYWSANMDLAHVSPVLNLYNEQWPIRTVLVPRPPAKFVFADPGDRMGIATDSLVSPGCIISGGRIDRSVLFPGVRINSFSYVAQSVLFEGVNVGRHCRIRKAIIDKGLEIPPNTEIGHDLEADRRRFHVSDEGIVVIPRDSQFEKC